MSRRAWILSLTVIVLGIWPAQADTSAYRGYTSTDCRATLWDTCATPFHDERVIPLTGGTLRIAPWCVHATGSVVCDAGVQRRASLVGGGPVPYAGPIPPGLGRGIEVTTVGPGGTLSIAACNNDALRCPGEITFAIEVTVPPGTSMSEISSACLVLVTPPAGTLGLCSGGTD